MTCTFINKVTIMYKNKKINKIKNKLLFSKSLLVWMYAEIMDIVKNCPMYTLKTF